MSLYSIILSTILASAGHSKYADDQCGSDPDFCGSHAVTEPIRSCTEGYYYNELEQCCTMEVVYDPMFRCHNGGVLGADGMCICESHPNVSCPVGYTYDRSEAKCSHVERVPMVPSCGHRPELYGSLTEDGRQCTYLKNMEPRMKCPSGAKLHGSDCVYYEMLPHDSLSYTCPDGWMIDYDTHECTLVERVDCHNVKTKKSKCKAKSHKDCDFEDFSPCQPDCVIEDSHRKLCDGDNCKVKVKPEHLCQAAHCKMAVKEKKVKESSFVEPVVCERVTSVPAKPYCADGVFNAKKGGCCFERHSPAEHVCSPGVFDSMGNCTKEMHYLSDYVCPQPFQVSCGSRGTKDKHGKHNKHSKKSDKLSHPSNCECVLVDYADTVPFCADEGIGIESYDAVTDRCISVVPALPYCPERDSELINGLCVRVDHEPARLEYTVTYVTEEPCKLDECIREHIPIKKRKVSHKEVHMKKGKAFTKCHDTPCVNGDGMLVDEPLPSLYYPEETNDGLFFK